MEDFEVRHVVDSLLVAPLLEGCASVLDIGAGPGFPAWPLAWLLPGVKVTAVESNSKMADFARSVALPNLTVVQERMESMDWVEEFDAVTGRAVAPFSIQLEISAAPCRIGGRVVPFRVPEERPFIETFNAGRIGLELSAMIEIPLPGSETNRLFPIYTKVRATPSEFPRPWARMKARPL
ncbi:MAG: Ribosomal RNA small subunit methyltransferase G [Fimbriimonadaceae bacterium]|nr:Ribosomal RNA small subunit methyltransferase G [Fimbriimonadaceae bacterium]